MKPGNEKMNLELEATLVSSVQVESNSFPVDSFVLHEVCSFPLGLRVCSDLAE